MSFFTGTGMELLYVSNHSAATINFGSSGAEAQINTAALFGVQAHLPLDFWLPNNNQKGRGIHIVARGTCAVAASPTYTVSIRGGAAGNVASAPILLGTSAFTVANGSIGHWYLSGDVILTAIGAAGGNSTVLGRGSLWNIFTFSNASNSLITGVFGGGVTPGTATLDTSIVNYINFNVACGTVSSSNTFTLNQLLVYGLN